MAVVCQTIDPRIPLQCRNGVCWVSPTRVCGIGGGYIFHRHVFLRSPKWRALPRIEGSVHTNNRRRVFSWLTSYERGRNTMCEHCLVVVVIVVVRQPQQTTAAEVSSSSATLWCIRTMLTVRAKGVCCSHDMVTSATLLDT